MQVLCNQCHAVSEVDAHRADAAPAALRCQKCDEPLQLPAVEIGGEGNWLVLMPHGQAGPYGAAEMAQLLDQASIDWNALIWRVGLKGWRAARRDPQLVTSVAAALGDGAHGDTQRVSPARPLVPATDTVVEPVRRPLALRAQPASAPFAAAADASGDEEFTQVTQRLPGSDPAPSDPRLGAPRAPSEPAAPDAIDPDTQPVLPRASTPSSWLPNVQSMAVVAVVAFGFGVFAAALWGRVAGRREQRPATLLVRPARQPTPHVVSVASDPARAAGVQVESLSAPSSDGSPLEHELRREVRRVSPEVRRCVQDLGRGAEVEVYFQGRDGRVREVRLRTSGLSAASGACITRALRQMQVSPFRRESHRFWYRFAY